MRWLMIVLIASIGTAQACLAQGPVHFTFTAQKTTPQKYTLHIVATINEGWHIYSQSQPKGAISQPVLIKCASNPLINIPKGDWKEIGQKEMHMTPQLGVVQYQYSGQVEFVKYVTLKATVKTSVSGTLIYQTCTDERCLNPTDVPFTIALQ